MDPLHDGVRDLGLPDQHIIYGRPRRRILHAETARRVSLRIDIEDEGALFGNGERGAEVDRGRGLPDTALLVRDRYYVGHALVVEVVDRAANIV